MRQPGYTTAADPSGIALRVIGCPVFLVHIHEAIACHIMVTLCALSSTNCTTILYTKHETHNISL